MRHNLGLSQIGENKALALARRLNDASPSATVVGVDDRFQQHLNRVENDLILDATAAADTLSHLELQLTAKEQWFASIWIGWEARRAYCFSIRTKRFCAATLYDLFDPWRRKERDEFRGAIPPRSGVGCWHSVFPARADDIWLLASVLVKHLASVLSGELRGSTLAVFEQMPGDSAGAILTRLQ